MKQLPKYEKFADYKNQKGNSNNPINEYWRAGGRPDDQIHLGLSTYLGIVKSLTRYEYLPQWVQVAIGGLDGYNRLEREFVHQWTNPGDERDGVTYTNDDIKDAKYVSSCKDGRHRYLIFHNTYGLVIRPENSPLLDKYKSTLVIESTGTKEQIIGYYRPEAPNPGDPTWKHFTGTDDDDWLVKAGPIFNNMSFDWEHESGILIALQMRDEGVSDIYVDGPDVETNVKVVYNGTTFTLEDWMSEWGLW